MPRIRSLKYEYFINEDLAQTSFAARMLGLGLTTIADREGRLEDRPMRIKVLIFPYDDVDVDQALNELQKAGFLHRYETDSKRYIRIVNFLKHQKPHPREADSVIPGPEMARSSRGVSRKGKPRNAEGEGLGKPSKVVNGSGNGLGDLGLGVSGNGDSVKGSGDPADAGASATDEKPKAQKQQQDFSIWTLGVGKLMASDVDGQEARSFLGGLRNKHGSELLSSAITKMLAQNPLDPKAYLVSVLKGANSTRAGTSKTDKSIAAVKQVIQEYEQDEH